MPLLEVDDLRTYFKAREGDVRAVDGVSFDVEKGETLGIVGESGCGKSVTALSIMGLLPKPPARIETGRVLFEGRDLVTLSRARARGRARPRIGMIFQDPMTVLTPTMTIGRQIARRSSGTSGSRAARRERASSICSARSASRSRSASTTTRTSSRAACASA